MRHTSGLTYRDRGTTPPTPLIPAPRFGLPKEWPRTRRSPRWPKAPLLFDPGSDWEYGFSTDVLGFVVEAVTGKSLGSFLQERLWGPLGMIDTSFASSGGKARPRYALALAKDPLTGNANPVIHHSTDKKQQWDSGGGGAVSTAVDYLRFVEMLRAGGKLGAAEILGRGTGEAHDLGSPTGVASTTRSPTRWTWPPPATASAWAFAVRQQNGIAAMAAAPATNYRSGVFGSYYWVDLAGELAVVFMAAALA